MAEYVNKEEVLEHCEALPKLYREAMRLFIKEIPSVNIVRCKECKHHDYWRACTLIQKKFDTRKSVLTDDNHHCGWGERKKTMYYPQVDGVTPTLISNKER